VTVDPIPVNSAGRPPAADPDPDDDLFGDDDFDTPHRVR